MGTTKIKPQRDVIPDRASSKALLDNILQSADGAADHGETVLQRLHSDHGQALLQGGHEQDVGRRHDCGDALSSQPAVEGHAVFQIEFGRLGPQGRPERTFADDVQRPIEIFEQRESLQSQEGIFLHAQTAGQKDARNGMGAGGVC